jgi:hypothetical protein
MMCVNQIAKLIWCCCLILGKIHRSCQHLRYQAQHHMSINVSLKLHQMSLNYFSSSVSPRLRAKFHRMDFLSVIPYDYLDVADPAYSLYVSNILLDASHTHAQYQEWSIEALHKLNAAASISQAEKLSSSRATTQITPTNQAISDEAMLLNKLKRVLSIDHPKNCFMKGSLAYRYLLLIFLLL